MPTFDDIMQWLPIFTLVMGTYAVIVNTVVLVLMIREWRR
jgi:hypothetical protein